MHLGAATLVLGRGGCGVEAAGRMLSVGVGKKFFVGFETVRYSSNSTDLSIDFGGRDSKALKKPKIFSRSISFSNLPPRPSPPPRSPRKIDSMCHGVYF